MTSLPARELNAFLTTAVYGRFFNENMPPGISNFSGNSLLDQYAYSQFSGDVSIFGNVYCAQNIIGVSKTTSGNISGIGNLNITANTTNFSKDVNINGNLYIKNVLSNSFVSSSITDSLYGNISILQGNVKSIQNNYLLKSGGTISGSLDVTGGLTINSEQVATTTVTDTLLPKNNGTLTGDMYLNDNNIYLRENGDTNHYLKFNSTYDGPILAGYSTGAFGVTNPGSFTEILKWDSNSVDVTGDLNITGGITSNGVSVATTTVTDSLLPKSNGILTGNMYLNSNTIYLVQDSNHYIKHNSIYDGPIIAGWTSGALGVTNPGSFTEKLKWNDNGINVTGTITVGATGSGYIFINKSSGTGYSLDVGGTNGVNVDGILKTGGIIYTGSASSSSNWGANGCIQIGCTSGTQQEAITCKAYNNTYNIITFYNTSSSLRGYIGGSTNSVSYSTSSDKRLKTNIKNMPSMIEKINLLRPVIYDWINSDNESGEGFIAQEVFSVFPSMRTLPSSWNGLNIEEPIDEFGKPIYYGLDYSKFTPYLVRAVQELSDEIKLLKEKLANILL